MTFLRKAAQTTIQAGTKIGRQMDTSSAKYVAKTSAVFVTPTVASVKWNSVVPNAIGSVSETFSSSGKAFAQSYMDAQADKESRANDMMGPVWSEFKDKSAELLDLSSSERSDLKETLSDIKDSYKENEKQIKNVEKGVSWMNKLAGPELKVALSLESSTISTVTKVASTATKVVTAVSPVARAANTVVTAYEVVRTLYPEQTEQAETYVKNKIDEHVDDAKEKFSAMSTSVTLSLKERMQGLRRNIEPSTSTENVDETKITMGTVNKT